MCEEVEMTRAAEVVDHIEPVPQDATFEEFKRMSNDKNLQALCHGHHNSKTAKERNEKYK